MKWRNVPIPELRLNLLFSHLGIKEDRYRLLWAVDGRVFFVVYTIHGTVLRIISARKANQREVSDYENSKRKN
jgi:uncharacterized DUF497 family protein